MKKIISLTPNLTDIIRHLGCSSNVLACTEECDLDNKKRVGSWISPNLQKVRDINPDIVFTCNDAQEYIERQISSFEIEVVHLSLSKFSHLFDSIDIIASHLDKQDRGDKLNNQLLSRTHKVKEESNSDTKPVVYCEEWDSPHTVAGRWIPEMVEMAGGCYPYVQAGHNSRFISRREFVNSNPEISISHIRGEGLMNDFRSFRPSWDFTGDTYFMHDKYMNWLSPKTIDGLEALSEVVSNKNFGRRSLYQKK